LCPWRFSRSVFENIVKCPAENFCLALASSTVVIRAELVMRATLAAQPLGVCRLVVVDFTREGGRSAPNDF
jgi:hypothetical protein